MTSDLMGGIRLQVGQTHHGACLMGNDHVIGNRGDVHGARVVAQALTTTVPAILSCHVCLRLSHSIQK